MQSKVLTVIANRPFVKEIVGDSFTGRITVTLHEGFQFKESVPSINEADASNVRTFASVRAAAMGASRNTVKNLNASEKKPNVPRVKRQKPVEGTNILDSYNVHYIDEVLEAPYEFVGPLVDLDAKGRPLSMTPNAIRKRNKAKAAKEAAQETQTA